MRNSDLEVYYSIRVLSGLGLSSETQYLLMMRVIL